MSIIRSHCLLCNRSLEPMPGTDYQQHPTAEDCLVKICDRFGIAIDCDVAEPLSLEVPADEPPEDFEIQIFPFVEDVLVEIFEARSLKRLGGVSSGRGWSSISVYQRCPYAFKRRYLEPFQDRPFIITEPAARAIGTLIHVFLAVYYTRMIDQSYPLTPQVVRDELLLKANPDLVHEGWRVFTAYALYRQNDIIQPLAIEYDLRDPRTGESCRYDLIAFLPENQGELLAGTYVYEHKSTDRFDDNSLNGWSNDGECLGQVMLWERLGLDNRFGPLKGLIVNLLGKQKECKFHRTLVAPQSWQTKQHKNDLKRWEGLIQLSTSMNQFPRSRGNCINRFGKCDYYDFCSSSPEE